MDRITNIRKTIVFAGFLNLICTPGMSQEQKHDTIRASKVYEIGEVVVTGSRNETDVRHLSQTVSVINRIDIEHAMQPSLLPVLTEQIPGLFVTSRGIMGYGVLKVTGVKPQVVALGVIDLRKCTDPYLKLKHIYERVQGVISSYLPDELAIEVKMHKHWQTK